MEEGEGKLDCVAPLDSNWKLPRARDRLDHNVGLLDTALEQLGLGSGQKRLNDGVVPAGVDDADAQATAVVVLRRRSLGMYHCVWARLFVRETGLGVKNS